MRVAPSLRSRGHGVTLPLCALAALVGCVQEQRYAVENEAVALTADAEPAFINEDDEEIFIVSRDLTLQITPPPAARLAQLASLAQGKELPFPRLPWVALHDLELQLDYTLANQGDEPVTATVLLNGRNEFHAYTPGPEDFSQWERRFLLEPKQRVHGTVTELELDEMAIDLATVVNGAPNSNEVVHFSSQSGRDTRNRAFVPSVVPGLVGLSTGIMTNAAADVVLEVTIRVQDHGDRAAPRGKARWELPEPTPFVPVAPEEE